MEPAGEAAVMHPASDAGVADSALSSRAASPAAAEFSATSLWAELYSEARRWIVRIWLSESRSRGGDSRMRAESSETMTSVRPTKRSWEWSRQMLQSAASSRTRGKGGQPSAVRDEGKDTGFYPGSAPRRVKTYSCYIVLWRWYNGRARRLGGESLGCMMERISTHPIGRFI